MAKKFKCGQAVEAQGFDAACKEVWERGTIMPWTQSMGARDRLPAGFHPVKFAADGARLMVHESRLRALEAE